MEAAVVRHFSRAGDGLKVELVARDLTIINTRSASNPAAISEDERRP